MAWQGLSPVDSLNLWNEYGWQALCYHTLREVTLSEDAHEESRILALTSFNHFTNRGVLPVPMDESAAMFICEALVRMSLPRRRRGWWKRWRARHRADELAARLQAARSILMSVESQMDAMKGAPQKALPEKLPS